MVNILLVLSYIRNKDFCSFYKVETHYICYFFSPPHTVNIAF